MNLVIAIVVTASVIEDWFSMSFLQVSLDCKNCLEDLASSYAWELRYWLCVMVQRKPASMINFESIFLRALVVFLKQAMIWLYWRVKTSLLCAENLAMIMFNSEEGCIGYRSFQSGIVGNRKIFENKILLCFCVNLLHSYCFGTSSI
jgi:hypothetical protein